MVDMVFEGEVIVKEDSEVVDVHGGRQSRVVNGESEVVSFCEGRGTDDEHF